MKKILKNFFLIIVACAFIGCSSNDDSNSDSTDDEMSQDDDDGTDDDQGGTDENPNPDKITTYTADVKTIFDDHCISCHANPPTNGAPFSLMTYDDALDGIDRDLIARMQSSFDPMPPSGVLSDEIINVILDWEADGLLEE